MRGGAFARYEGRKHWGEFLESTERIRVGIAEESPFVRRGLERLAAQFDDVELIVESGGCEEIGRALQRHTPPDVVVVEPGGTDRDGLRLARSLARRDPTLGLVVVGSTTDRRRIEDAVRAGARGYVLSSDAPHRLLEAVRVVGHGGDALRAHRAWLALEERARERRDRERQELLSPRQIEVLRELSSGDSDDAIAERLSVAPHTLRAHVRGLQERLGLPGRDAATAYSIAHRFVLGRDEPGVCGIWDLHRGGGPVELFPEASLSIARFRVSELERDDFPGPPWSWARRLRLLGERLTPGKHPL
jgi:DNA-binding NarL/FixJ family response regulator